MIKLIAPELRSYRRHSAKDYGNSMLCEARIVFRREAEIISLPETADRFFFGLHNVFTPTRNAVNLSMHGSNKEHTNT